MTPTRFTTYVRKETGDEFRYIGFGQLLKDGEPETTDVLVFSPVLSGFDIATEIRIKKTPEHTLFFICDQSDFESIFAEFDANKRG